MLVYMYISSMVAMGDSSQLDHWQEFRADRVAALCSRRYAEGGVEFFRNSMQMDALAG